MCESSHFYRWLLGLMLVSALTYTLGNASVVLWDRDEPRYAQTSRQMLESGDWVVPRLLDEPREKKPALIYWLQASAMKMLGTTAFAARLPSVVFVTMCVVMVACLLRRTTGDTLALMTAAILASSTLVIVAGKLAITDGVLLLFTTVAQLSLFALVNGDSRWRVFILFGIAQGLALLTKGPVAPAVSAVTMIAWFILQRLSRSPRTSGENRSIVCPFQKTLSPHAPGLSLLNSGRRRTSVGLFVAILIATALCLPWWIAIEHRSPGWTWRVFHNEVINRAATPQEGHKGPPGFYLATIWGTFFPWSLLLPIALIAGWKDRREPAVHFALAATAGPWLMFEISATKLVHYLLPVYPALAFLVARWIIARHWQRPAVVTCIAMLAAVTIIYAGILPRIPELRVSKRLAEALLADGATQPGQEWMVDYKETSLAFYQGGTIRPESRNDFLLVTPLDRWPQWLVMSEAIWKRMPTEIQNQWATLRTIHGWNLAGKDADGKYEIDVRALRRKN